MAWEEEDWENCITNFWAMASATEHALLLQRRTCFPALPLPSLVPVNCFTTWSTLPRSAKTLRRFWCHLGVQQGLGLGQGFHHLHRRRAIPTLLRAKQNLNADEAVSYSFPFSGGEEAGDFQVGDVSNPGRLFGGDDETEQDDEDEEEEEEEEDGIYFDDDEDEENLFGDNDSSELDDNEEDTEAQIDLFRSSGGEGIMPSTEEKVNKLEELCARVRASGERTVTPEDIAGLYDFKFDKFQVQFFCTLPSNRRGHAECIVFWCKLFVMKILGIVANVWDIYIVLFQEYHSPSMSNPADIESDINFPTLGIVTLCSR